MDQTKRVIIWFRNNLRVADNVLLANQLTLEASTVIPVFIFDPRHFGIQNWHEFISLPTSMTLLKCDNFRTKFQIESVYDLKNSLKKLKSDLHIFHGKTEDVLASICDEDTVILAPEIIGIEENDLVQSVKDKIKGELRMLWGGTFVHIDDMPEVCQKVESSFTKFRKKIEEDFSIRELHETPECLPPTEDLQHISGFVKDTVTLETFNLKPYEYDERGDLDFKGGENAAIERLHDFIQIGLATYKQTRSALCGKYHSSHLSPWLSNGCISAKQVYWAVIAYENANGGRTPDTYWLIWELICRDYFRFILKSRGASLFAEYGPAKQTEIQWKRNDDHLLAWIEGKTGIPFLDANMRQLNATGWMSNRGRQNVASFLIHELHLDWRVGAAFFEQKLLDHDVALNYGNWAHAANLLGGRRNRFNLLKQGREYDPEATFTRTWVPELKNVPIEFVFEPWKMNSEEQIKAECVLGKDYPESILLHTSNFYGLQEAHVL